MPHLWTLEIRQHTAQPRARRQRARRHTSGRISASTVRTSRRPIHIAHASTIFDTGCRSAKFDIGPTAFNQGPMFPKQAIAAVIEVTMSAPKALTMSVQTAKVSR